MNQDYHKNARIFLIDDEVPNLKLLDKMLSSEGYQQPILLQDPRTVIKAYRATPPDLILLDLNMPYLDGYAVMEQLQALDDPMLPPVIILTAQHSRDHLLRALAAGARDFVTKPFDRNELLMRVRNMLDAHLAHRLLQDQYSVLEDLVLQRTEELQRTRLQVLHRLGSAIEYRHKETGNHILRVSHMCVLLAQKLGWNDMQCDLIRNASPLYDVGKIGIPDAVLEKLEPLDTHEWKTIQSHTVIGAELLADDTTPLMQMARTIALTHHEKWDGSGYPRGLSGQAIPMAGRIAALADVFDAMTSERPYRKAWALKDAVEYIQSNSGKHFDPALVAIFLRELPGMLAIQEQFIESRATYSQTNQVV